MWRLLKEISFKNNNLFIDPVLKGTYPKKLFTYLETKGVVLPAILPGDMEIIRQELDFLGVNTYSVEYIIADAGNWPLDLKGVDSGKPRTDAGWEVAQEGMYDLLKWIDNNYLPKKIIITENGAACNDWVDIDGRVEGPNRKDYIRRYLI